MACRCFWAPASDTIEMESRRPVDKLLLASSNFCTDGSCIDVTADNEVSGTSWTVSVSYDVADSGIIPYVTMSEQATVIAGQGAELTWQRGVGEPLILQSSPNTVSKVNC